MTASIDFADHAKKSMNISLNNGWNLVSSPVDSFEQDLPLFLKSIDGSYGSFYLYDDGRWLSFDKDNLSSSGILTLDSDKGFWIYMDEEDVLETEGYDILNESFELDDGLNLVSYVDLSDPLIGNRSVFTYRNGSWYSFNSYDDLSSFDEYIPGYGYFIKTQ